MEKEFAKIVTRAEKRKGSDTIAKLMYKPLSKAGLRKISDDRYLAAMTKVINQAGFSWQVIDSKWPDFEEAFFSFDLDKLSRLHDEEWEAYTSDKRVVRNGQKIMAVRKNVSFIQDICAAHGSFGAFLAYWPYTEQIELLEYMKKNGGRMGGNSGQWFLRRIGWDGFILSGDVVKALQDMGLDIKDKPSSKKEMRLIQDTFNDIHAATKLPISHISKYMAYSIGENYDMSYIDEQATKHRLG